MNNRPIDILDKSKGKRVMIKLKNKFEISGEIKAYDMHLNMWLDNAEITVESTADGKASESKKNVGTMFVRGDNVLFISPSQ